MTRIYEPFAYGPEPIRDCFWPTTVEAPPDFPELVEETQTEFAVVGGGYTGISAALTLAEAGADVVLLDAERPGWGASGRNGGLVSIGSAKLDDAVIRKRLGHTEAQAFFDAERVAVYYVAERIERHGLQVDRHSQGYTHVAHTPAQIDAVRAYGESYRARYGLDYRFLDREEMAGHGLASPEFHGAATVPVGFALNPLKFALGLARAAVNAGARVYARSPVTAVQQDDGHLLITPKGRVRAKTVLFATNGYAGETVPAALAGRYLPVQSNILVSRPLTDAEIAAQGWSSGQMVVDSRQLLHYFRLMPDRRMLFGLRGTVRASAAGLTRTKARARADFDRMFPAWRRVDTPYFWSGLICMTRALMPFAGPVPGLDRAFAAFGYHGSGVSMAPYAGALIADMALGRERRLHPAAMQAAPRRFELGRWRRAALGPAFAWYQLLDRL